jgi:4-hydroxy-tetrahydrodipicolinate synthase
VLDEVSLRRCIRHFAAQPIEGLILGATTGEGLTLEDEETERLVSIAADELANTGTRMPLYLGLSGSDARKGVKALQRTAAWPVDGYLIACPYYTRPSQLGLLHHFSALAEATARPILIYNIPYRTGVNLGNDTMLQLAEHANIVGVKDCSADAAQSFDLLRRRPPGFAVLTGEDALFYGALTQGADGGILASAHIETRAFVSIRNRLLHGELARALADWRVLCDLPRLLFTEPGADQALAVARRPDRQPRAAAADDAGERRPRRPDRPGDRADDLSGCASIARVRRAGDGVRRCALRDSVGPGASAPGAEQRQRDGVVLA